MCSVILADQVAERRASAVGTAVCPCARFIAAEGPARFLFVAVDLPGADAFGAARTVSDEAGDVLRRVAEEQPDLMREFSGQADAPREFRRALLCLPDRVAPRGENIPRLLLFEVVCEPPRTVHIDQCPPIRETEGDGAQSPRDEDTVIGNKSARESGFILHLAGEHTAGLQPGEQLTLKDVLYCLMLSSANEACNVVAEYISSDVPSFVALMNKTAQELGCKNTHFANPHGLHESDHYTTAMDLSLITRKALGSETFREISGCAEYTVPATNLSEPRNLKTTNYLISTATVADYYYPDAIGIKTGYTSAAGRCVISRAADGNLNLLCVIMNATTDMLEDGSVRYNNFIEARKLFDYGFDNFAYAQVLTRLQPTAQVPVRYGRENKGVVLIPSKDINCVLPKDYDKTQVTTQYQLDTPELEAPLTQGQKVGNISVYYGGQKIGETTIETLTAVEASGTAKAFEESKNFLEEYWWLIAGLVGLIVLLLLVIWLRLVVHRARRRRAMRKRRPGGSRK